MSIFSTHYDNSLVYIGTEWSTDVDPVLNVKFARGPFSMDYHCLQSRFMRSFKEDFTEFYENVIKDYDEVTGRSNTFEKCFDAMVDGMTEIDYNPTPRYIKIDFDPIGKSTDRQSIYDDLTRKYFEWDSEVVKTIMNDTITMMEETK